MKLILRTAFLAFGALCGTAALTSRPARADDTPRPVPGWLSGITLDRPFGVPRGQTPDYQVGIDTAVAHGGKSSAFIKAVGPDPKGFRAWTQVIKADTYQGKRLRLTGWVKTQDVATWSGLWVRVDSAFGATLAFDNMGSRAIKGTTDWQPYSVVVDVPSSAAAIFFGSLLNGAGQLWVDDLTLETVDTTVASTGDTTLAAEEKAYLQSLSSQPTNADFEAAPTSAGAGADTASAADSRNLPAWFVTGQPGKEYAYGVDTALKRSGKQSAFVKAAIDKPHGYCGLGQNIKAEAFRGKRVRLSGYIKADAVAGWAGLWMNVIGEGNEPLGFDNMHNGKKDRAIKGTTDWQPCFIVLDVPQSAQKLNFGALLSGAGRIGIDDVKLEVVSTKVASTAITIPKEETLGKFVAALPARPTNLDFEQ